jgi:hypothetical protein
VVFLKCVIFVCGSCSDSLPQMPQNLATPLLWTVINLHFMFSCQELYSGTWWHRDIYHTMNCHVPEHSNCLKLMLQIHFPHRSKFQLCSILHQTLCELCQEIYSDEERA